jgi:hypothetical protein
MVSLNKWEKGEQLFTFIDGKTYRDSEAMTLAKKYGYNTVERVYETYNSLG